MSTNDEKEYYTTGSFETLFDSDSEEKFEGTMEDDQSGRDMLYRSPEIPQKKRAMTSTERSQKWRADPENRAKERAMQPVYERNRKAKRKCIAVQVPMPPSVDHGKTPAENIGQYGVQYGEKVLMNYGEKVVNFGKEMMGEMAKSASASTSVTEEDLRPAKRPRPSMSNSEEKERSAPKSNGTSQQYSLSTPKREEPGMLQKLTKRKQAFDSSMKPIYESHNLESAKKPAKYYKEQYEATQHKYSKLRESSKKENYELEQRLGYLTRQYESLRQEKVELEDQLEEVTTQNDHLRHQLEQLQQQQHDW